MSVIKIHKNVIAQLSTRTHLFSPRPRLHTYLYIYIYPPSKLLILVYAAAARASDTLMHSKRTLCARVVQKTWARKNEPLIIKEKFPARARTRGDSLTHAHLYIYIYARARRHRERSITAPRARQFALFTRERVH